MVAISWHSPLVNDSAASVFHTIVQLFMIAAATCPLYSVIQSGNGIFVLVELQLTSFDKPFETTPITQIFGLFYFKLFWDK